MPALWRDLKYCPNYLPCWFGVTKGEIHKRQVDPPEWAMGSVTQLAVEFRTRSTAARSSWPAPSGDAK